MKCEWSDDDLPEDNYDHPDMDDDGCTADAVQPYTMRIGYDEPYSDFSKYEDVVVELCLRHYNLAIEEDRKGDGVEKPQG